MSDIEAIRDRARKATPGPWAWRGNVDTHNLHLRSLSGRMLNVLTCRRHGMQGAQPVFVNQDTSLLVYGAEIPIFEVSPSATDRKDPRVYRGDVIGFRNRDAEFIAHARQDVETLLARIDELERQGASA